MSTTPEAPIGDPLNTAQDAKEPAAAPAEERASRWAPRRLWHLVPVFMVCSLGASLTSSPGRWIADARLEYSTNPIDFLQGHEFIWDGDRGLGNTVTLYSPVRSAYEALLQLLGAEPWLIERFVHATYLTIAATGVAALLGVTRPQIGGMHLLAGLIYAFNPYTSQFLLPSGLFLSYALSPWLLSFFLRGTQERADRWRMAAWFALSIFTVGALNPAALLYALLPVPIAGLYLVFVERSVALRTAIGWITRASALSFVVSCGALVVLWFQLGDIAFNLATTERPAVVSSRSSWAESWRGLGHWVTYFGDSSGQIRPQSAAYFQNPVVIFATYAAPIGAAVTVALSHWRPRLFFGALIAVSLPLMVGIWPGNSPSPLGRLMDWGFENIVFVRGLRTTYKAGAAFYTGVAVLCAVGIAALLRRRPAESTEGTVQRLGSLMAGTALISLIVVASFPYWTGNLYSEDDGFDAVPEYWDEALDWINAQPDDGRVLVLPGVIRTSYRWGYVNDNLFHGLLDKSLVTHQSIPPPGTPLAADAVLAMDEYLASQNYRSGTIGPILRRLGVRWIVFQNDVEWERVGAPRPSHFDAVRDDPDLVHVRSFGTRGENTAEAFDRSAAFLGELQMQPVEIYELRGSESTIRVASDTPVLVAGAGDSWPQLAYQNYLADGPVMYTGSATDDDLVEALSASSPVVVTDGSRRRYLQVRTGRMAISHTLALEEETPRAARSPFPEVASQTVAAYADARSITASRTGNGVTPFDPGQRPAHAFDEVEHTAWSVTRARAKGAHLTVQLEEETKVDSVSVLPFSQTNERTVEQIRVELVDADGSVVDGDGASSAADAEGWIAVDVGGDDIVEVRLFLEDLSGRADISVGVSEVRIISDAEPLDLREFLRTPRDLEIAATRNSDIDALLSDADISYSFQRNIGTGIGDEETEIRRDFWAPRDDVFTVTGTLQISTTTPDITVDRLVGGEIGAFGSSRVAGTENGWGTNAVDGDLATSWLAPPQAGVTLTVRPPQRQVESVEFVATVLVDEDDIRTSFSRISEATVTATGPQGRTTLDVVSTNATCRDGPAGRVQCTESFAADLPTGVYATVELELQSIDTVAGAFGPRAVAVSEVIFETDADTGESDTDVGSRADTETPGCTDAYEIDGRSETVRLLGTREALLDMQPIEFESCAALSLGKGAHTLESGPSWSGAVSDLNFVSDRVAPSDPVSSLDGAASVSIIERSPTRIVVEVTAPDGAYLLGPGAFHKGWNATVDGLPIGDAVARDTLSAWRLPSLDRGRVELEFRPQRTYELALATSAAGVAICLYFIIRRRPSR